VLLLLELRDHEQELLLLLLLLKVAQNIALDAGRRVGTVGGLLALQALLLLAPGLACSSIKAVWTGVVIPSAIALLIHWWWGSGI